MWQEPNNPPAKVFLTCECVFYMQSTHCMQLLSQVQGVEGGRRKGGTLQKKAYFRVPQ